VTGIYDRFEAADKLTNRAVHADVALEEAEMCAILTYVLAGEILRIHEERTAPNTYECDHLNWPRLAAVEPNRVDILTRKRQEAAC
jgi:hypothetical protein